MRVLIAPQEFKGSLTASEAAHAIASGVLDAIPNAEVIEAPMSDGGPGIVEALLTVLGGKRIEVACHDPLMRPIRASFAIAPDGTAVIEMAAASGLVLLRNDELNPLVATTFGTGDLILAALDGGCRAIILGVGGSATVDGGAGAAQALGVRLLDADGHDLPPGGAPLLRLDRIDTTKLDGRLREVRIRIASDVRSTLLGETGAARMFGPQKGATSEGVETLEEALAHFATVLKRDSGVDVTTLPGSAAAGGLGAALVATCGATIESGFDLVAEVTGLRAKIAASDIVITGEGRLDAQTAYGKTASGVAAIARSEGKPVGVLAGSVDVSYVPDGAFDEIEELKPPSMPLDEALRQAPDLLRSASARLVKRLAPSART